MEEGWDVGRPGGRKGGGAEGKEVGGGGADGREVGWGWA